MDMFWLCTGYSAAGPTGLNAIGPAYQLLRAFRHTNAAHHTHYSYITWQFSYLFVFSLFLFCFSCETPLDVFLRALLFCKPEDMASYQGTAEFYFNIYVKIYWLVVFWSIFAFVKLKCVVDYSTMLQLLIVRCPLTPGWYNVCLQVWGVWWTTLLCCSCW